MLHRPRPQRVAPPAGPNGRRRLRLPRHRSTTANLCAIYPAAVQAPLPPVGPLLGVDLSAGDAALHWDPFEIFNAGLTTNPNVFVMGEPGYGKSSLIKCWAVWQTYLYGEQRWLTFTDPKGEYRALADLLGMTVMRIAPGGTVRINPLEAPAQLDSDALVAERDVQTTMLASLAATQLARPLMPLERKVIRSIVATITGRRGRRRAPTLVDVIGLMESPTDELRRATHRDVDGFVRDTEDLRYALDELCTGPLRGMFDGPSSVTVDWDGPGLVMDLSGVVGDSRAMALVMVAAIGWSRQQRHRLAGRQRINVNDESYYMYKQVETVEFAQERRKLGRQYGEANVDICHRPSDLAAQADDGSKVAKMAHGLLADSSMKIVFRQAASQLDEATVMLGLTENEADCIRRLVRAKAIWKIGDRSLLGHHDRPEHLLAVTDTDAMMRRDTLIGDDSDLAAVARPVTPASQG